MRFALEGWTVAATMRDPSAAGDLAETPGVFVEALDVTGDVGSVVDRILKRTGQIDALVNNAGYGYFTMLEQADIPEVQRMFDVNVFGILRLLGAVVPVMRTQGEGVIVNISSIAGKFGLPHSGVYAATKHAVEAISESLSHELALSGIRVVVIEPGFFVTDFQSRSLRRNPLSDDPASPYAELHRRIGVRRAQMTAAAGDPQSVADDIYRAVTDPSTPFRVPAGADAHELLPFKRSARDEEWMAFIRGWYGL